MFVLLLRFQETLYFPIEVGCNALGAAEYIVFCLCFVIGNFFGDAAFAFQDLVFPERKELVDAGSKLLHGEGVLTLDEVLDVIEVTGYGAFQLTNLLFVQIVFRNGHIGF